jgi:hypothetical protein
MAIYYTSINRKWRTGQTILFIHRADSGDAIVGYGLVESAYERDELSEEERHECERHGWKRAIAFKYVVEFEKPLQVKGTFLGERRFRGRYCHGIRLSNEQLGLIMTQAEALQR